jgi:hypothetical protein
MRVIVRFLKDENAATAIEYGLIAAGIAGSDHSGDHGSWHRTEDHV